MEGSDLPKHAIGHSDRSLRPDTALYPRVSKR
jgi:hypothetical protein